MIHSASEVKFECDSILTCAEGDAIEVGNSAMIRIVEISNDEVVLEIDQRGESVRPR